jgi:glutamine synthetase
VECIIGDIAGVARGKAMPAAKFAKQTNYFLPNSIFLQTITGEWADNPFDAFTEPDMILNPTGPPPPPRPGPPTPRFR